MLPQSEDVKVSLAEVPPDIRACFTTLTGKPLPGAMSKKELVALVTKLRKSEVSKSRCGVRLLALYDEQAALWSK